LDIGSKRGGEVKAGRIGSPSWVEHMRRGGCGAAGRKRDHYYIDARGLQHMKEKAIDFELQNADAPRVTTNQ
jgi:hypothetical protein